MTVERKSLNLHSANLSGLNFAAQEGISFHEYLSGLTLPDILLVNATFDNRTLISVDFYGAQMTGASFRD